MTGVLEDIGLALPRIGDALDAEYGPALAAAELAALEALAETEKTLTRLGHADWLVQP